MEKEHLEMVMSMVQQTLKKHSKYIGFYEGDGAEVVNENEFDDIAIEVANFISVNFSVMRSLPELCNCDHATNGSEQKYCDGDCLYHGGQILHNVQYLRRAGFIYRS